MRDNRPRRAAKPSRLARTPTLASPACARACPPSPRKHGPHAERDRAPADVPARPCASVGAQWAFCTTVYGKDTELEALNAQPLKHTIAADGTMNYCGTGNNTIMVTLDLAVAGSFAGNWGGNYVMTQYSASEAVPTPGVRALPRAYTHPPLPKRHRAVAPRSPGLQPLARGRFTLGLAHAQARKVCGGSEGVVAAAREWRRRGSGGGERAAGGGGGGGWRQRGPRRERRRCGGDDAERAAAVRERRWRR